MLGYKKVSIVIPAYNELATIEEMVERTKKADVLGLEKEIIIVDNLSTDGTRGIIQRLADGDRIRIILHERNEGVGKSWRDGIEAATGEIVIRQDADTEYRPEDFPLLLKPILNGEAKIVYGSRLLTFEKNKYFYKIYLWGGLFVNWCFNFILQARISDALTASKAFDKVIFEKISLHSMHFEIEAELTAKALRAGFGIKEVPITYRARSFEQGKKIHWWHAFIILRTLIYYRFAPIK